MSQFHNFLSSYTQSVCGLLPDRQVLVGISGGPDSLCLLDALHQLGFPVIAAHFNHHLRESAGEDAIFVQALAAKMGVEFILGEGDVITFSQENSLSVEEGARTLRYRFLFEQARLRGVQAVAVGHNADDQVETVLMHLLRGAGLDGLTGMRPRTILPIWDQQIPLVRPLLDLSRAEILTYCQERDIQARWDETNQDTTYFRNRLRHELIPHMEKFNPRFREVLTRTAKSLAADQEELQSITNLAWERCLLRTGQTYLCLSSAEFSQQAIGIRQRVLRKGIESLRPGLRDVDFYSIKRVLEFLTEEKEGICEITGNLRVFSEGDRFWVAEKEEGLPTDEWPQMASAQVSLDIGSVVALRAGWHLHAKLRTWFGPVPEDPDQAWLKAENITTPLIVRCRRPGDSFQPLGMKQKVKLSDFLINEKIPRRARDSWPLVCMGDEIVWIPGVRLSEQVRVSDETEKVVCLSLERK